MMAPAPSPPRCAEHQPDVLHLSLFGSFTVRLGDRTPVVFSTRKEQELLAYLVLHPTRAHARESLASLLWDDVTTAQSRKYLRRALWRLRRSLANGGITDPARLIRSEGDGLRFVIDEVVWVDVMAFEAALDGEDGFDAACSDAALHFYKGELLEGWYEDWCLYERERLRLRYVEAIQSLAESAEHHGDFASASGYAVDWVHHDRLNERAHAFLMRARYLVGDRTGAAHQYAVCSAMLKEEMGVVPSASTQTLYEHIRKGDPLSILGDQAVHARTPRLAGFVDVLHRLEDELLRLHEEVRAEVLRLEQRLEQEQHGRT